MSTSYFIGPIDPNAWSEDEVDKRPVSDLEIDPDFYYTEFQKRWPFAQIFRATASENYVLSWTLDRENELGSEGGLQSDLKHVSFQFGNDSIEFILWHRALISSEYVLYLFNSSSFPKYLILTSKITAQDIQSYLGRS